VESRRQIRKFSSATAAQVFIYVACCLCAARAATLGGVGAAWCLVFGGCRSTTGADHNSPSLSSVVRQKSCNVVAGGG
jgi:hypothetical protein